MKGKRLSVFMPVYNGALHLREALDSILGQSLGDFELLVLDDGSKDDSAAILQSYSDKRLRVLRNRQNRGLAYSFNRGFAACKGEFIARMDADDIAERNRLRLQLDWLQKNPETHVLGSWLRYFGRGWGTRVIRFPCSNAGIFAEAPFENPVAHPSVMLRASVLGRHRPLFRSAYQPADDYDLWSRMLRQGVRFAALDEPLLRYRLHAAQSGNLPRMRSAAKKVRLDWVRWLQPGFSPEELNLWLQALGGEFDMGSGAAQRFRACLAKMEVAGIAQGLDPGEWGQRLKRVRNLARRKRWWRLG